MDIKIEKLTDKGFKEYMKTVGAIDCGFARNESRTTFVMTLRSKGLENVTSSAVVTSDNNQSNLQFNEITSDYLTDEQFVQITKRMIGLESYYRSSQKSSIDGLTSFTVLGTFSFD